MVADPKTWVEAASKHYQIDSPSPEAATQAGLWNWKHGDLIDRLLAATSAETGLTLIHTDRVLKNLDGFPHRYFRNVGM